MIAALAYYLFHIGAVCLSTGLSCLGALSMAMPSTAAELYGLAAPATNLPAIAWVEIAGMRDLGLGLCAHVLYMMEPRSLRYFCPMLILIPVGDAWLTLKNGGTTLGALTHFGGVVAIGILSLCAWLNPQLDRDKHEKSKNV